MITVNKSPDTLWHQASVTREHRQKLNNHQSAVIWFTGLSGSGKSTLAHAVEERLHKMGNHTFVFDGDNVRHGLCSDLGFSESDRKENIRRIGEMVKLFTEAGIIALTAFISPFRSDRQRVRDLVAPVDFIEIFCRCPLEVCETRDVKGIYKRARTGEIQDFTGISSPYEEPAKPELIIDTSSMPINQCVDQIDLFLQRRGLIQKLQPTK